MNILAQTHHAWISLAFVLLLLATAEGASRLARRRELSEALRGQLSALQAALLGLLGLLLAFTFALSSSRYDARRELVLEEGDAIGTAWLRAMVLDEPARGALQALLRRYADSRIAYYDDELDPDALEQNLQEAQALERALWTVAANEARAHPDSPLQALVLQSLNAVIDLREERLVALHNTVPDSVVYLLFVVAVAAVATCAYCFGVAKGSHLAATLILSGLVGAIVFLTLDLDRPRQGLIRVSQEALTDVKAMTRAR